MLSRARMRYVSLACTIIEFVLLCCAVNVVAGATPAKPTGLSAAHPNATSTPQPTSFLSAGNAVLPGNTFSMNYEVFHYIDQGGIRDQTTGNWMEAFSLLIPKGWQFTGGLRWVAMEKNPAQLSKTDANYPVRSDFAVMSPDGRCFLRSYPPEFWVDTTQTAQTRMGAGFSNGANYNGMIVWPVVSPLDYIGQFVYPRQHGQVQNPTLVKQEPLPKLATLFYNESARFEQIMGRSGISAGLSFQAGTATIDYLQGQTTFRETFIVIMEYLETAGMIMYHPRINFSFRAPRDEFDTWQPVLTTMATSMRNNPRWSLTLSQIINKAAMSQRQMDAYCHRIQQEIAQAHGATNSEIAHDLGYLSSPYFDYKGTDGNRYTLPTDKYHFMNSAGELLSQDRADPPSSDWVSIEPYNQ